MLSVIQIQIKLLQIGTCLPSEMRKRLMLLPNFPDKRYPNIRAFSGVLRLIHVVPDNKSQFF